MNRNKTDYYEIDLLRLAGALWKKLWLIVLVTLLCGADESPLQLGSIGARIAQMYLMDVLFSELCRRNLDQCRQSRARIADALAEKHM